MKNEEKINKNDSNKISYGMKSTSTSIIIAGLIIAGAIMFSQNIGNNNGIKNSNVITGANNVSVVDGKQIIEIKAKGGYTPRASVAKAGIPTILRFTTSGTYDCSASIRIPSLGVAQLLPQSGSTDIDLGTPASGTLDGTCGMGMYPFEVEFR